MKPALDLLQTRQRILVACQEAGHIGTMLQLGMANGPSYNRLVELGEELAKQGRQMRLLSGQDALQSVGCTTIEPEEGKTD